MLTDAGGADTPQGLRQSRWVISALATPLSSGYTPLRPEALRPALSEQFAFFTATCRAAQGAATANQCETIFALSKM